MITAAARAATPTPEADSFAEVTAPGPRPGPPAALYVHIPFCVSICPYCDFVVYAGRAARGPESRIGRFAEALRVELGLRADALDARWGPPGGLGRPPLDTLYLGGGTPSLLPADSLNALVDLVRVRFGLADGAEVSLEINPGPDERGDAGAIRRAGVTRLSIGAQSFDPAELRTLGRRRAPADVAEAVRTAKAAGIASVSIDLLYDIPGQTLASWSRSLDTALALEPDHLSLYALTLDDPDAEGLTGPTGDHVPLRAGARRWRERARDGQDEDRAAAMYELVDERLAAAGYAWYEISNWARPGHESRHNLSYWQGRPWEAAGPGAHAFDGERRRWNGARLDAYLEALLPGDGRRAQLPPGGIADAAANSGEAAMLRLRTRAGLPAAALTGEHGEALQWALDAGLLAIEAGPVVPDRDAPATADRLV
ncbi:MAG TPA: coproporphyrinogen-III oxidase family protein, partial [Candidatus Binatia bacterium]|nr:coproporphyrinogen-III oxidase family protein [Candidatus Binatia bacterium]